MIGVTGKIRQGWKDALKSSGVKPFMGDDASAQSGTLGDALLHESAVSWAPALRKENEMITTSIHKNKIIIDWCGRS